MSAKIEKIESNTNFVRSAGRLASIRRGTVWAQPLNVKQKVGFQQSCAQASLCPYGHAGFNVKSSLARAGTANNQNIFISIIFRNLGTAHHNALGLHQENVLVEVGIDMKGFISSEFPPAGASPPL